MNKVTVAIVGTCVVVSAGLFTWAIARLPKAIERERAAGAKACEAATAEKTAE